ncbi:uncharacterized protein LOC122752958 [Dromiciops gliroides]|uniref:uncharacterized protein LOC122752958 n=1 Tax=Dromiciops gliroides TaxID=33562 RepID=UPI001CC524C1|nr:uncharacterized protein LOC122752958 [Dromiciops gliroides]
MRMKKRRPPPPLCLRRPVGHVDPARDDFEEAPGTPRKGERPPYPNAKWPPRRRRRRLLRRPPCPPLPGSKMAAGSVDPGQVSGSLRAPPRGWVESRALGAGAVRPLPIPEVTVDGGRPLVPRELKVEECSGRLPDTMGPEKETSEESVILISDDETDTETTLGNTIVVIEPSENLDLEEKKSEEIVDEESGLVVTFCKKGMVMPHARHDCMTHPFERTESETCIPVKQNSNICGQCYCYVCDKLASECQYWTTSSSCHCNAHNKSKFWKDQRNFTLTGVLVIFNLEPTEIDTDLRRGGELLFKFLRELSIQYNNFLSGEIVLSLQDCMCPSKQAPGQCSVCSRLQNEVIYRYSDVFNLVSSFINKAEKEKPKTAAVMLLGVAREIALHKDPTQSCQNLGPSESLKLAVPFLMSRITKNLQRMLVLSDFPKKLYEKFISFFQTIPLPPYCFKFTNCLNVVSWDHRLLTTVLKGQNITGEQKKNGKKEFLWEVLTVIKARTEKMENMGQYKELVRYLRAVKCNEGVGLKALRDKIPLYLCKSGDFTSAAYSLLLPINNLACCTACRLSPLQFESYLKMFWTGSIPSGKDFQDSEMWILNVGSPVKCSVLIKQALRVLYNNQSLYRNSRCWSALITILGSSPILEQNGLLTTLTLREPSPSFRQMVWDVSFGILEELKLKVNVTLPSEVFYGSLGFTWMWRQKTWVFVASQLNLEACFLLTIQAALQMVLTDFPWLTSFLEIILAFGKNFWALKLFLEGLLYQMPVLHDVVSMIARDLSYQKHTLLKLWQTLGPDYVGELLCLFLSFRNSQLQSVGIFLSHVIIENLNQCPWAKSLDVFRLKAFKRPHLETANHLQLNKFVSILENL